MAFTPYFNMGGNCREAFTRYHEIFGGKLEILGMDDMPAEAQEDMPESMEGLVMHAALTTDDGGLLMGSDVPAGTFTEQTFMYSHVSARDVGDAKRIWAALSEGGEIEMDAAEVFWSPFFGVCRDRFGMQWMVDAGMPEG